MKKIAIIGASGFVGSAITNEALLRNYKVTALVKHPENMVMKENMIVLGGDVMNTAELSDTLKGFDIVISAYNPGWSDPDIYDKTIKGYISIITACRIAGVKRLLIVGGAGSLYVEPGIMLMETGSIPENMLPGVEALAEIYIKYLPRETQLDWVFFSPAAELYHGERTGDYRLGRDELLLDKKGKSKISVEDYAKAMIDEAESPAHHRERFTIGYKNIED